MARFGQDLTQSQCAKNWDTVAGNIGDILTFPDTSKPPHDAKTKFKIIGLNSDGSIELKPVNS